MNDFTATFPPIFPAPWACEWGEDRFGLFMVLNYQGVRQRFRWIAPGTFKMGSPETESERYEDEVLHSVTLTQGFWLADSACTQALWTAVMSENPSRFQDDINNPVENVNWEDAQRFIARLNEAIPDLHARLPSEAEWEYACRAGTSTPFSFGENITPVQVNYDGNYPYADGAKGLNRQKTVAVKSLPPNAWGLYEMHGNVWEWCADLFGDYAPEAAVDPSGPEEGSYRVLRGGSWFIYGGYARSAPRHRYDPALRDDGIGFRLALGRPGASGQERQ
jgi:formylglycine-generating enzyme required for sulfatase activity